MSTEVRVKTRVIQKHGTSSDWNQATNFVPLQGEIIVYDDLKKFKIGDGTTSVIDLPFSASGIETITAGKGLTGGGSASSTTLNVGAGSGITVSADAVAVNTTYTTTGKNYAVAVDTTSGGLYVTVPWTDTNTDTHYTTGINAGGTGATANAAVSNPYITIKDNSTYRGQVQLKGSGATSISSDANGVITISSTDNNTTYSAATTSAAGLMSAADKTKLDGIATGADAVSLSRSLTSGTKIGTITINGTGTDLYCQTNTDTCNTAGSHEKSDKLFLVGCLSQGPYYETFSNSKCYASGGYLYSNGTKVLTSHQSLDNYSTLANTIKSLSISGKTITYTKGDGTTGTLTTQDTNTTYNAATQSAQGLMSAADKKKLDGIAESANNYSLPAATSSALGGVKISTGLNNSSGTISVKYGTAAGTACQGNDSRLSNARTPTAHTHAASDITSGLATVATTGSYNDLSNKPSIPAIGTGASNAAAGNHTHTATLKNASGTAVTSLSHGSTYYLTMGGNQVSFTMPSDNNTTYNAATQSAAGLMSANDKKKLDGIAANANNYTYTLPNASSSTLGGVKVGSNITVSSGTISLTKANVTAALGYTPPTSDTNTTYSAGTGISLSGTTFSLNSGYYATSANSGLMSAADKAKLDGIAAGATALTLGTTATTAAKGNHTHNYLPLSGGNVTGHIYLTGAQANSSTANTSQIVFGTSSDNHVAISSNNNALVINPTSSTTTNQIVLYLDQASSFPSGIMGPVYGNASSASKLNTNAGGATQPVYFSGGVPVACSYYVNKTVPSNAVFTDTTYSAGTGIILSGTTFSLNTGYYATSTQNGLMSASDKSKLDGIAAGATALSLGNTATTAAKGNHTHSTISNAFTVAAPTATTPNYPFQIKYNNNLIFKVRYDGTTYADKGYYSTGADYAEYFEWLDANPFNEDRRGLFVTMSNIENGKIELAQNSDNIVGIVSANPSMVGNDAEMHWSKKYLTDVFGSYIMEEVTHPATVDQNGKLIPEYTTHEPKLNPEYNPDLEYIPRSQRKEWAVIGLLGQLVVCDDGSCWPGGYCKCGANGVATVSAEPGWRVLARLDENHIRILFK